MSCKCGFKSSAETETDVVVKAGISAVNGYRSAVGDSVANMDQFGKMKQHEGLARQASSKTANTAESSRVTSSVPFKWESLPGKPKPCHEDSGDESEAHEPRVVQLNLRASLMGVHILDDDEELFFSRQSSMSSMIADKSRSIGAVPFKWEAEPGTPLKEANKKAEKPVLTPPPGSRASSSRMSNSHSTGENGGRPHSVTLLHSAGAKNPSGILYPLQSRGGRANSSSLNAAHFTFRGDEASTSGANNLTEKIFKKLVGQSRLRDCNDEEESSGQSLDKLSEAFVLEDESDSPVSTLDHPASPSSSERSIRLSSKQTSLRRRSEDANHDVATEVSQIDPNAPRPKSQLAQYLMSMRAMSDCGTDDDDIIFEGPRDGAWDQPEEQKYHPELPVVEGYTSSHGRSKPTHERWTSNSSSWNLSLMKPLKTVSTIVDSKRRHSTGQERSKRTGSHRDKDPIMPISLTSSYDGSSTSGWKRGGISLTSSYDGESRLGKRAPISLTSSYDGGSRGGRRGPISLTSSYDGGSRGGKRGVRSDISLTSSYDGGGGRRAIRSEIESGRRRYPDFDSGKNHYYVISSSRLQIDVENEPDLDEPDMEQANDVNRLLRDDRAKVDEDDFPFDSPIASSFVFGEAEKKQLIDAQQAGMRNITLPRAVVAVVESEDEDLQYSDDYHDPDVASITDSEDSLTAFSLEGDGVLDRPPQWVSSRSFNYVKEVVDSIGLSSRAMSGFLGIARSGRFSIDLQRGPRLDKAVHPSSPDPRLRMIKKASRRSLLSPCLPFLMRSQKHVPRLQQASMAASARRLQPINSFTARLGPVPETSTASGQSRAD